MKNIILGCFFALSAFVYGQNPEGFEKMAKKMEGKTAPIITRTRLISEMNAGKEFIFLDSRELNEFEVSHLTKSIWIGYNDFQLDVLKKLSKEESIVVYCSVGYRSGKTAEKLRSMGFKNVYNLYGGIFDWANNKKEVQAKNGQVTNEVHGYNDKWSKYLNKNVVEPVLK